MNQYRCCGTHLKTSCVYLFFCYSHLDRSTAHPKNHRNRSPGWKSELLGSPVSHRYLRAFLASGRNPCHFNRRNRWKDRKRWATPGVNTAAKKPGVAPGARSQTLGTYHENQRELRVARCLEFFESLVYLHIFDELQTNQMWFQFLGTKRQETTYS